MPTRIAIWSPQLAIRYPLSAYSSQYRSSRRNRS
jgi:hypothetical protein